MNSLAFRQVHLDFHTSEAIPNVGKNFSKAQFQHALKLGHVDSITVFSKCHHGWAYHPSKANEIHPGLNFDLLGEMIEAAHEIDVKTPVYLSAGLDEKLARRHPEWLIRGKSESLTWTPDFMQPGYHKFCFNTPYLDILISQIEEVLNNYNADGIFLDIVGVSPCYCQNCINTLRSEGKDPRNQKDIVELAEKVYAEYTNRVNKAIHSIKPGMRIFHNGGHICRGRHDLANMNTHLELESLPTGGWGYDHFPLSARYAQTLGMDFLGMTGKFHTSWGEFGGYKHPNALRYETALSISNGACCSIGDQLHPEGLMDIATYTLIGEAYREVEAKEEWCTNVSNVADIGLLSVEAANVSKTNSDGPSTPTGETDAGAVRILIEGKYLFNVIDTSEDFTKYKVIILPDYIRITSLLKDKLKTFVGNGGKVLATGESALNINGDAFAINFGVKWMGANIFKPDYFRPNFKLSNLGDAAFVFYSQGQRIELDGGTELGNREDPYFNKDLFTFCSHQHTPSSLQYGGPGMVQGNDGIYIAWNVFEDYATKGSLILKETIVYALDTLLGNYKTLSTNLPAQGIVTLMHQEKEKRFVNHLLYASPIRRGKNTEVIEDIIPIYNVNVSLKIPHAVTNVYLAPQMHSISFELVEGVLSYTVPELNCHQMIIIDYTC